MSPRVQLVSLVATAAFLVPTAFAAQADGDGDGTGQPPVVPPFVPVHVLLELDGVPGPTALADVLALPLLSFDLDLQYAAIGVAEEDPNATGFDGDDKAPAQPAVVPIGPVPPGGTPPGLPPGGTLPPFVPKETYIVRGTINPDDIPHIKLLPEIVEVWSDAEIRHMGPVGPPNPLGNPPPHACTPFPFTVPPTVAEVRATLRADLLGRLGGEGVVIGVVDGGIDAGVLLTQVSNQLGIDEDPVIGGYPADWGTKADKWQYHGNMSSFDALSIAPKAKLFDLRISDNDSPFLNPDRGLISDALAAYDWAIRNHAMTGKPDMLTNSWGIFDPANAPDYAVNRNHPFTKKVVEAIDRGMVVLFAAGNCGGDASFPYQSACNGHTGYNQSIWGANGHPRVMTVGAATTDSELLCFSSRGPSSMHDSKPDFLSVSHFLGFYAGISQSNFADSGTSAACAVTAGILANLLERHPGATQEDLRWALRYNAEMIGSPYAPLVSRAPSFEVSGKWNPDSGAGLLRVYESMEYLEGLPAKDDKASTGAKKNQ